MLCYQARKHLLALDPQNAASLQDIETAAFALVLDEQTPENMSEVSAETEQDRGKRFSAFETAPL